jgi:hypothetical protein
MTEQQEPLLSLTPDDSAAPHPKIQRVLAHWRSMAPGPGLLPGRQHLDPVNLPDLLAHLWLVDVVRGERVRYRFRLIGGEIFDAGAPMRRGMFLDELGERIDQADAHAIFDAVTRDHLPDWRRGQSIITHSRYVASLERIILPLAADGRTVDVLLGATVFYRREF